MTFNLKKIEDSIDSILPKIIEIRQHLHTNPELSLEEYKTSKFIREQLSFLDLEVLPPFLETDVVALLNGNNPDKNVTLRADIDALPINEKNEFTYRSKNKGIMHACGHDGHTAILLGAAIILGQLKELLNGSVRFVFQPGEEIVAAGKELVASGVLANPKPDATLALHGWPGFPVGTICSRSGTLMAAADVFKIIVKGKGGHGSKSNLKNNPIIVASSIVTELSLIPTKEYSSEKVVVSVSMFVGGSNPNVIPSEVVIEGSTRYLEKSVGENIPEVFKKIINNECVGTDMEYELEYSRPYIPTINNSEIISKCKDYVKEFIGESVWIDIKNPVMSSEDFSYYIDENPGGMFFLGMGENSSGLHTENYNFNDKAIKNGILFFVLSTIKFLSEDLHT